MVDTNPVIESISGERENHAVLKWTIMVSDDEPFEDMVTSWEYINFEDEDDTRTFQVIDVEELSTNSGTISALMLGYKDSDTGMLRVTVCEGGLEADCSAGSHYRPEPPTEGISEPHQ